MMNKPTVLSSGEWLLPTAVWRTDRPDFPELDHERFSNVLASYDSGRTFSIIGGADVPNRWGDEHMIVERNDRTLWMLVRTRYGIGESISNDRGHTWSDGQPTDIKGPDSRFYIRRLISGNLLLVNHDNSDQRTNMTAYLSQDDGKTWQGGLLLDGRDAVSYPDGTQSEDGLIYIIYDRSRREDMEILIAIFREEDILAEKPISGEVRLHVLCNKGG
jgi:predicted neuraminidase